MSTLPEKETYIPEAKKREEKKHNKEACELYITRLTKVNNQYSNGVGRLREYIKADFYNEDFDFLGGRLFFAGCKTQKISDSTFEKFSRSPFRSFDFLNNDFRSIVSVLNAKRVGEIFSYSIWQHTESHWNFFRIMSRSEDSNGNPSNSSFEDWLKSTIKSRKKNFYDLLDLMIEFPAVPIEILTKLN